MPDLGLMELHLRNGQRQQPLDLRWLRRITLHLLRDLLQLDAGSIGIRIVSPTESARLNETFLQHSGPADVITFDYGQTELPADSGEARAGLHGEIVICLEVARRQAREFRTAWQEELVRYVVHGVLHLLGYDDREAAKRRRMKREENRLVVLLARKFDLKKLAPAKIRPK